MLFHHSKLKYKLYLGDMALTIPGGTALCEERVPPFRVSAESTHLLSSAHESLVLFCGSALEYLLIRFLYKLLLRLWGCKRLYIMLAFVTKEKGQ